jgi:hypothetical protein
MKYILSFVVENKTTKYILSFVVENETTVELFSENKIIKNIMKNNKEHEIEDNSFVFELISCKYAFEETTILHVFFLTIQEHYTPNF